MNTQVYHDWKMIVNYPMFLLSILLMISDFGCGNKPAKRENSELSANNYMCKPFMPELFLKTAYKIHGFPAFSNDMDTVFWPVIPPKVLFSQEIHGNWTKPQAAQFSERNIQAPFYDISRHRLLFQLSRQEGYGSLDIWYVKSGNSGWAMKKNLGSPPNSDNLESQPSIAQNGNLYFTGYYSEGCLQRGIYRSIYINGQYMKPELLPETINTSSIDYMPFISPDEGFLLFSSSRTSLDEQALRIYLSFRDKGDIWSEPINLNTLVAFDKPSRFPSLTPDGQSIIFLSENQYWKVPIEVIEIARRQVFK